MENFQKIIELATAHEIATDMDLNVAAELLDSIDEKMKERVMTKTQKTKKSYNISKKLLITIGVIVVALTWAIGTVNGQTNTGVISEEDVDLLLYDTAVEIEWEEAPIAVAAGFKDASSLGKKSSKSTTNISRSDKKRVAKLFGFKDASGLDKVKGNNNTQSTRTGKKKIAKAFGFKDASGLDKVKGNNNTQSTRTGKKKVAKAFGFKDAASIEKSKREVITISKTDHKHIAKMFGFKAITTSDEYASGKVKLSLDEKQKKLIAKAFGFKDAASLKGEKKKVRFTKSEKNEIKKALRLR